MKDLENFTDLNLKKDNQLLNEELSHLYGGYSGQDTAVCLPDGLGYTDYWDVASGDVDRDFYYSYEDYLRQRGITPPNPGGGGGGNDPVNRMCMMYNYYCSPS